MKTSTDEGATWSAATQLSSEAVDVYQVQVLIDGSTASVFWSKSDTSRLLQYRTSTDLASWAAAASVGQPIGPLQGSTYPSFGVQHLGSGSWALSV